MKEELPKIMWCVFCIILLTTVVCFLRIFTDDGKYYESIVISHQEVDIKNHFDDAERQVKIWETLTKRYPKDELIKEQLVLWKFNEMFYIRQIDQMFPAKEKKK